MNFLLNLNTETASSLFEPLLWISIIMIIVSMLFIFRSQSIAAILGCGLSILSASFFANERDSLQKYSKSQLGDLSLTVHLELYKHSGDPLVNLGKASLTKKISVSYLGQVSCEFLTFKQCIDEIKNNKEEIVKNLESNSNQAFVVSQ